MILKGSQRGGASDLASHLLRTDENEHVEVAELRGFVSDDLRGALSEAYAISKGTRCDQFMFSLSLSPPKDGQASRDDLMDAVERAEDKLGLTGLPRAIVIHEKQGRRHAHAVWSRVDPNTLKSVNLPFFKTRLAELSKDLYLDHGWELPEGHKEKGKANPLNYDLAEWQATKRSGLDPKQVKQVFQDAWRRSTNLETFREALAEKGFFVARGNRRAFVAVDLEGKVYSVSRMVGVKTKELEARLGGPDQLRTIEAVKGETKTRLTPNMKAALNETRRKHRRELTPLRLQRRQIVRKQRTERTQIGRAYRAARALGNGKRALRIKDWKEGAVQHLTGELPFIRNQNADESFDAYQNYRRRMEAKFEQQLEELRMLQRAIDKMRLRQQQEQMAMIARIAIALRLQRDGDRNAREIRPDQLTLEF